MMTTTQAATTRLPPVLLFLVLAGWTASGNAQPPRKKTAPPPAAVPQIAVSGDWQSDVDACLQDARSLPVEAAAYTRYFTFRNSTVREAEELKTAAQALTFHLWSIAHEPEPPQLRWVNPTLAAINLESFGIDKFVFGRLTLRDPYHHVRLTRDGQKGEASAAAPQLAAADGGKAVSELIKLTSSQAPLLRWDWFFTETSIQEGRGTPGQGTGYYDFIGVTSRDDFQKAVGADPKVAERLSRRWRAIIKDSGVAHFPRQIERIDALGGGYWFSLDVLDAPTARRNALRQLGTDFEHQAEEHYAIGPAGMPWVLVCNEKGALQPSAPDKIGPDKTRSGNRTTIDAGAGCFRCHKEILRPLDNWVTETLRQPVTAELAYDKARAAQRLYFRGIQAKLENDRKSFADRQMECNGLDPKKNADLYIYWQDRYNEDRLTLADVARELGTTERRLLQTCQAMQSQKTLDPILADFVVHPPNKIRRESFEELFGVLMIYLGGKTP
jgi:hypothetical protein